MEKLKDKLEQLKVLQSNLEMVVFQKHTLQSQLNEIENALKEIDKMDKEEVYKLVGNLLIKKSKEEVKKELLDRKEVIEIRLESLNKQEEKIREKITKLQAEIMRLSKNAG